MRVGLRYALLGWCAVSIGACSQQVSPSHGISYDQPPRVMFVPFTALIQPRIPAAVVYQVLPASDGDIFIARGEKAVEGALPLAGLSYFTAYTYDSQVISRDQGNVGYRYRWVVQQGVNAPIAP